MTRSCWAWGKSAIVSSCLLLALPLGYAQNKPAENQPGGTRSVLVGKARSFESRGRPDMAAQLWQQILLSDPDNAEALAGLARDYKLMGNSAGAGQELDRLRRVNPNDPNIAKIQNLSSTQTESEQLRLAGELARQGRAEEAVRIYRQLYGDTPPDNDVAMAYYQTLYATANGKANAVTGMRGLVQRNPGSQQFSVVLGVMLTYDPRTRAEGIQILQAHPQDAQAQKALRQALMWNAANPNSAGQMRQYLRSHPGDAEVAGNLKANERKLAQMNTGIARNAAERAAFAALNAHRLDDAQKRFDALLQKEPTNGRVLAGMGFLRMQQKKFADAINYLSQAEQNGYKPRSVESALEASRFWDVMSEATEAFNHNQLDVATARYKAALVMNDHSADALNGLAGVLTRQQQYAAAAGVYEQLVASQPASQDGWRGLFLAYANDKKYEAALAASARFPESVKKSLTHDPEYLRTLAAIYQAQNRNADAERVLEQALALPFPNYGSTLKADTKLQYAGILMQARRYSQALPLYTQVVGENPNNVSAWMGLVGAYHELGHDTQAITELQRMPRATYESSLADPSSLSMLGAIYQQAGQYDTAQDMLERAAKIEIAAGGQPSTALQLQLAGIDLLRNNPEQAYAIFQRVVAAHPDRADAWKGLIGAQLATNRNAEALSQVATIPAAVRTQLEGDIEFQQSLASLYAAAGDSASALAWMKRVEAYYANRKTQPPSNIEIQNAWLLYNTGNDRALYGTLMRLGGRSDLSVPQRETIQTIWANWSVRRATQAMDSGDTQRAVDILNAAMQAFPDNLIVQKAVAGGYARVGRARDALKIFKSLSMQNATAGDYQAAIGAALAANDKLQAEAWLRVALERFAGDPGILSLAARYEQARGDNQRAAVYWRAALAAMPASAPTDKLAHELVYPEQSTNAQHPGARLDLKQLLNPDYDSNAAKRSGEPAYGPDPYNPPAPQQVAPGVNTPSPSSSPLPDPVPPIKTIPSAQPANPHLFQQQSARLAFRGRIISDYPTGDWSTSEAIYHPASRASALWLAYGYAGSTKSPRLIRASLTQDAGSGSWDNSQVQIAATPPHSMATDAYKGLLTSLTGSNRNTEALAELNKIPSDVRRLLESDIEFVQAVAGLYLALHDKAHATAYLNRVENYYARTRTAAPAGLAIQHAWLLYNSNDDLALYPVMMSLDARQDLTQDQRGQLSTLWANWAMRRAQANIDQGNIDHGLAIIEAAAKSYPDNSDVRRALAGAYSKAGRSDEALSLYKNIKFDNAQPADYEGAIGAAMGAKDMKLAEAWLRQALGRFPINPQILAFAARFEEARGNKQGAIAYWRAALANMPAGTSAESLQNATADRPRMQHAASPADMKRLLDPRNQAQPPAKLPPLPSYNQQPVAPSPAGAPQQGTASDSSPQSRYTGTVNLPPSERSIDSIEPPQRDAATNNQAPAPPLRISAQPMGDQAARAQALFAAETDSQLTQGSAAVVHTLPNAPVETAGAQVPADQSSVRPALPEGQITYTHIGEYTTAQYTPSSQDAATGAYSVPRTQLALPPQKPAPVVRQSDGIVVKRRPAPSAIKPTPPQPAAQTASAEPPAPPLSSAPAAELPPAPQVQPAPVHSAQSQTAPSSTGVTDEQLEQQNLPPLSGPWSRERRHTFSPREEAEMQLHRIEGGYSGWIGGTGYLNYRSGALGYDHLAALEAPFEISMPMDVRGRFTLITKPVFLDSGQADGTSLITVLKTTTSGTALASIPQPIGTLAGNNFAPPSQQNAMGIAGEAQLTFPQFAIAAGYTPYGFLVTTVTGRLMWRPANGPITITAVRDSQKDSQLSYAGLRDPAGNTLTTQGQVWGGVVSNQGNLQYAHGDEQSGFYFNVGGQYLTGRNVLKNYRIDGNGGAYWRVKRLPEYGDLNIGVNFFAMHYAKNQNAFTHGMGGYFSPQGYFLANVPFTYNGHYSSTLHYNLTGGFGVQAFQQDKTKLWPLAGDLALQVAQGNPMLPDLTSVGANYDLRGQLSYQISPHWFAGGFFGANNTRNYTSATVGFSIHYMFRAQPSSASGPTGLFPSDGLRPFTVP